MSRDKITHLFTKPVVLDAHRFGSTLTITGNGEVDPSNLGATAITAPSDVTGAKLVNHGVIIGGTSIDVYRDVAGSGVDFVNAGFVGNDGTIEGGAGTRYGAGGIGIDLQAGGTVANHGLISGGTGYGYYDQGGGAGIYLGGTGKVTNSGTIAAGSGTGRGNGGIGVDLKAGGTLVNHGLIEGGLGATSGYYGADGGSGVALGGAGAISNSGTILGGFAGFGDDRVGIGGNGISATDGSLANQGLIVGGSGLNIIDGGYHGGDGVNFTAIAHVSNSGTIEGGQGAGNGIDLAQGGTLINTGTVTGGYGFNEYYGPGTAGGAGVIFGGSGTVANSGSITGGDGGYSAAAGGAGVVMTGPGILLNHGTITGGDGNIDSTAKYQAVGGVGVMLSGGATLHNSGTITGGSIIVYGTHDAGNGGAGVYLNGGTLVTSGTIAGGAPGAHGAGVQGDAVQFGAIASTLEIAPSAVFSGNIAADPAVGDTLVLAGTAPGTLAGFGNTVTGFTTIVENSHAHWTLSGTIEDPAQKHGTIALASGATLELTGAVHIAAIAFGANDLLGLGTPGSVTSVLSGFGTGDRIDLEGLQAGSLSYSGGTLTLYGADQHVVDTLVFSGSYTGADFGLRADGVGGTKIVFNSAPQANDVGLGFSQSPGASHAEPSALAQWHALPPGW